MTDANPRDVNDLPQLTPEQMRNLKDLLGTYRNHLGLNDSMPKLSPAAQAVWEAFNEDEAGVFVDYGQKLAAALRAAAYQVLPEMVNAVGDEHDDARREQWIRIRRKFLVLAAELEAQ